MPLPSVLNHSRRAAASHPADTQAAWKGPATLNRRQFLLRSATLVGTALIGLSGYGTLVEPREYRLEQHAIPIAGLSRHLAGFKIGVLTDLHLGPLVSTDLIHRAVAALAAQKPDLTLIAGDMTSTPDALADLEEVLAPVAGALAVLGNWDFRHRHHPYRAVRLLMNEGLLVAPGLWIGGLEDGIWGEPDLDAAMRGAPDDAVRILLAHEPDLADLVQPEHRIALQVSGHSHGGQVRLPLVGPLLLPPLGRKYPAGLASAPSCQVYTSRGLGMTHLPIRFGCPPEITLLTLTNKSP